MANNISKALGFNQAEWHHGI